MSHVHSVGPACRWINISLRVILRPTPRPLNTSTMKSVSTHKNQFVWLTNTVHSYIRLLTRKLMQRNNKYLEWIKWNERVLKILSSWCSESHQRASWARPRAITSHLKSLVVDVTVASLSVYQFGWTRISQRPYGIKCRKFLRVSFLHWPPGGARNHYGIVSVTIADVFTTKIRQSNLFVLCWILQQLSKLRATRQCGMKQILVNENLLTCEQCFRHWHKCKFWGIYLFIRESHSNDLQMAASQTSVTFDLDLISSRCYPNVTLMSTFSIATTH